MAGPRSNLIADDRGPAGRRRPVLASVGDGPHAHLLLLRSNAGSGQAVAGGVECATPREEATAVVWKEQSAVGDIE